MAEQKVLERRKVVDAIEQRAPQSPPWWQSLNWLTMIGGSAILGVGVYVVWRFIRYIATPTAAPVARDNAALVGMLAKNNEVNTMIEHLYKEITAPHPA